MNLLKEIDFFKQLDEKQQEALSSKAIVRKYSGGDILFFEGEAPKSFIFLLEGNLKLYKTDPKGNEFVIHRFVPVTPIAEMAVLEQRPFPASAAFESSGTALFIEYRVMQEAIEEDSSLAFALMGSLSRKIKNLEQLIEMNIVLDSTARVAKYILEYRDNFATMKKNLIAQQLNMTPETFSRTLKKLKTMGLIDESETQMHILNEEGLRALFEG
jgi:CRP/FNR family transcriptional regulator